MSILKGSIETNAQNYTRFAVITREENAHVENPVKASFVFSTLDKPGALFHVLQVLTAHSINMKKLESRPIPGKPWEYMFYVDVDIPEKRNVFDDVVNKLKSETEDFRVLGMYKV